MRSVLGASLLMVFPASAQAFGLGTTVAGFGSGDDDFGFGDRFGSGGFGPTFDLVFDPVIVQIHATETLDAAFSDQLYLGVDVLVNVATLPIAGAWSGVVQPGGGVDLLAGPDLIGVHGECRFGIQAQEQAGFGVYVVPVLGFVSGEGDSDLYAGGALQVSVWFAL